MDGFLDLAQSTLRPSQLNENWWTGEDSNLRSPQGAADLQSAGFSHSPTRPARGKLPTTKRRLPPAALQKTKMRDTRPFKFPRRNPALRTQGTLPPDRLNI